MRAVVYERYGGPDVLELRELDAPRPAEGEVLVRVRAASVNSWDWELLRGTPFMNRIGGLRTPKHPILGADVAGEVEAVGPGVTRFQPGDEVFGDLSHSGWGGFAEYVAPPAEMLATKPPSLSFEEAAAVPQAAVAALQGLRDSGRIRAGQQVLVNGAGGGMGSFAVQLAKHFGATVTGVDAGPKVDLVRSLGADELIDYTEEDFTARGRRYDLVVDMQLHRSMSAARRVITPNGRYVIVGGATSRIMPAILFGPLAARITGRSVRVLIHKPRAADLVTLTELIESGAITPAIDRRYPLAEVAEALRYFGSGQVRSKLVIAV
jgi:NADPH:quinone reductase-like Zn-dependent oxidoreductase